MKVMEVLLTFKIMVAQVKKLWIHRHKGFALATLYDCTSVDAVLTLNKKISINGSSLMLSRWRHIKPKCENEYRDPRKKHAYTSNIKWENLRNYETYSEYKRDQPQYDAQHVEVKPVLSRKSKKKRRPWKRLETSFEMRTPKSNDGHHTRKRKTKHKTFRQQSRTLISGTPHAVYSIQGLSRNHRISSSLSSIEENITEEEANISKSLTDYKTMKGRDANEATHDLSKAEQCSEPPKSSTFCGERICSNACTHLYDHSRYLLSINVDNNNILNSIYSELWGKCKIPASSVFITYEGKCIDKTWPPYIEDNSNIHIVVKGKGGMMEEDDSVKGKREMMEEDDSVNGKGGMMEEDDSVKGKREMMEEDDSDSYASAEEELFLTSRGQSESNQAKQTSQGLSHSVQSLQDKKTSAQEETFNHNHHKSSTAAQMPIPVSATEPMQSHAKSEPECVTDYQKKYIADLGLAKYFPNKLTFHELMCITDTEIYEAEKLTDIPMVLLRKLMMLDSSGREKTLNSFYENTVENKRSLDILNPTVDDLPNDGCFPTVDFGDESPEKNTEVDYYNPIDIFLSVWLCLHPTLQQKVCSKLFMCQLAVPLIYPTTEDMEYKGNKNDTEILKMSLWPLRGITVFDGEMERPLTKCKQHVISFVRLGRPSISKSKIVNRLLRESDHNTFFNFDCSLGSSKKLASEGTIEASWFLPSQTDICFKKLTLFLNLRGDAIGCQCQDQMDYLMRVSHVTVVLTDKAQVQSENTTYLFKNKKCSIVFVVKENVAKEKFANYKRFYERNVLQKGSFVDIVSEGTGGLSKLTKSLHTAFQPMLTTTDYFETLHKEAKNLNLTIDEDNNDCVKGKRCALDVFSIIEKENLPQIKKKHTPFQTGYWKKHTENFKKYWKGNEMTLKAGCDLKQRIKSDSQRAGKHKCTKLLKEFITHLQYLPSETCVYFLEALKSHINEKCMKELPAYKNRYDKAFSDFQNNSERSEKEKLAKAEETLRNANFGLEHIFRELGQLFETENQVVNRAEISKLMADLVIKGYPLELMDGEVGNIPTTWIKAIFDKIHASIPGKKILTISILGVQSSGKSTLLNTMFGLNFTVSAGRCTRGIFLYLLPCTSKTKTPFDYVLVVDTEGIRAPELGNESQKQHDNELATLVIGMADISIVNIKGEIASDITDVLQICVHTFMQLQKTNDNLKLQQSCIFIHQNVPARNAKEAISHGRNKNMETLNQLTKEAAQLENVKNVKCFSDIINFDSSQHIWYFSDLWSGDPPMAPVNIGYSSNVQNVQSVILQTIYKNKSSYHNVTDVFEHIENLWHAILANNFILNFTNTLELRMYAVLEKRIQEMFWNFEKSVRSAIKHAEDRIRKCSKFKEFNIVQKECEKTFDETKTKTKQSIDDVFENDENKIQISKWKISTEQSWALKVLTWQKRITSDLEERIAQQKVFLEYHSSFAKHDKEIHSKAKAKAKELAESMQGKKYSDEEINDKFEEMWNKWASKVKFYESANIDAQKDVLSTMSTLFESQSHLINREKKDMNSVKLALLNFGRRKKILLISLVILKKPSSKL